MADLSSLTKTVAIAALATLTLAAGVLVSLALSLELPGGVENVATRSQEPDFVARAVIVLAYLGLACAGAALVVAAADPHGVWGRATLAAVGIVGVALGGSLVELGRIASTYTA